VAGEHDHSNAEEERFEVSPKLLKELQDVFADA
jgi:hypothetical protein